MQKGGKQATPVYAAALRCEMQQGRLFLSSSLIKNIEVFRLAGYSTWTGEAVPIAIGIFYTIANNERFVGVTVTSQIVDLLQRVRFLYEPQTRNESKRWL